ncbi:MAG TPA: hypothetical protein VEG30_08030 [Terriglobales bacterium]|nr:hypothetical protein [Terriglobales bacterium]
MARLFGMVGLLFALVVGAYLYMRQATSLSPQGAASSPRASVDLVGVKNDLIAIANAERRHLASDGKYVPIEDLISNGDISMQSPRRGQYQYSSEVSDNSFRIVATYSGEAPAGSPHQLSIDETMQISAE